MSARNPDPRRIKLHRPYTVEELAAVLGVHKHTVRRWIKQGLNPIDSARPTMFRGEDARAFLEIRRTKAKRPCAPGEIYCFKCRAPRKPAGRLADLEVSRPSAGRLVAICESCGAMLYRRVNPAKILAGWGNLEIAIRQAEPRLRLFGRTVKTGNRSRLLRLRPNECVEVFLVSGSPQERRKYTSSILRNQRARIVLCSMQYVEEAADTVEHVIDEDFWINIQWLNPGYSDSDWYPDYLGIGNRLLYSGATIAVRSGKRANSRVRELREYIYGWAAFRRLIVPCP